MEALIMIAAGALCCISFIIGARVGQQVSRGERIELPNINPLEAAEKHRAKKEADAENDRMGVILRNIERYDGTAYGQEDVPSR